MDRLVRTHKIKDDGSISSAPTTSTTHTKIPQTTTDDGSNHDARTKNGDDVDRDAWVA